MDNKELDKLTKAELIKHISELQEQIAAQPPAVDPTLAEEALKQEKENLIAEKAALEEKQTKLNAELEVSKQVIKEQGEKIQQMDLQGEAAAPDTISHEDKVYRLTIPKFRLIADLLDPKGERLLQKGSMINLQLLKKQPKVVAALLKKGFGGLVAVED